MRTHFRWVWLGLVVGALGVSGCGVLERRDIRILSDVQASPVEFASKESNCGKADRLNASQVPFNKSIVLLEVSGKDRKFRAVAWFVSGNYLVTSYGAVNSVVLDQLKLTIKGSAGNDVPLKLIAYDEQNNLALLHSAYQGVPLNLATPGGQGSSVWVVGYSSGQQSIAGGEVVNLAFGQSKHEFFTSAQSELGFAGGPVLDCRGHVVGINTHSVVSGEGVFSQHISSTAVEDFLKHYNRHS